ncbi:FkbM family methyltransferase [Acidovorax sp.]|jgi:31-O-methyltransferase|uniref:FkbM family methyltransferase n=1 Tax=Acidovorax sp. TaxID=1872122 RepID=UPI0027B8AC4E|nr:FkbM family methyltransferase [Acidovorax sp.]
MNERVPGAEVSAVAMIALAPGFEVFCRNVGETHALYHEIFVEKCYEKACAGLSSSDVVFDVGANIGLTTLFLHRRCPGLQFHCFEPIPDVARVMRANLGRFGVDAKIVQAAVSDQAGTVRFQCYPNNTVMSSIFADKNEDRAISERYLANCGVDEDSIRYLLEGKFDAVEIECESVRLSDVIVREGVDRIDLLKIDVEKSEAHVLAGIDDEHWPLIRRVALEVHDVHGALNATIDKLASRGFSCEVSRSPLLEGTTLYDVLALRK